MKRLSYVELGNIVLRAAGEAACLRGYGTVDPEWVGRYALHYGDIRPDGAVGVADAGETVDDPDGNPADDTTVIASQMETEVL